MIVLVPSTVKFPFTFKSLVITVWPVAVIVHSPEDEIVKFVPLPSIFSPSSPNVIPTLAGMFTSPVAVKFMSAPELTVRSVSLDSIFSLASASNTNPTFCGI